MINKGFPGNSDGKESACSAGDLGFIHQLGRSPGEGNGYPLQYSCLENPMNRGTWQATVRGCKESDTTEWLTLVLPVVNNSKIIKNRSDMIVIYMLCIYHGIHYSQLNVLKGQCSSVVFVNLQFGLGQWGTACLCSGRSEPCVGLAGEAGWAGHPSARGLRAYCVLDPSWPLRGPRVRVPGGRKQGLPVS